MTVICHQKCHERIKAIALDDQAAIHIGLTDSKVWPQKNTPEKAAGF